MSWLSSRVSWSWATAASSWFLVIGKVRTTNVSTSPRPLLTCAARSEKPAVNRSTTRVMIPATTPSPTTSIANAASDRGQPRRTSQAAPGCSSAARSRATITGTTTTATYAAA